MFHHGPRHVIQIPKDKMLLQNLQNKAPVFGAHLGQKHPDACHSQASTNHFTKKHCPSQTYWAPPFPGKHKDLWGLESNLEFQKKKKTSFPTISYVKIWWTSSNWNKHLIAWLAQRASTWWKPSMENSDFRRTEFPQSFPPRMTLCSFLSFRRPGRGEQNWWAQIVKFLKLKRCTSQKFG